MTENSKEQTPEERLEEIKREEKEDASAYYVQGDSGGEENTAANYDKPVDLVNPSDEEMSFLKTVAFLGFGLATLAIVFILFFIRDLDERVVSTDKKVDSTASTVAKLDGEIAPFKQEVNDKIQKISADVNKLQGKIGDYERMMAVMELKRAMVTIQEVMSDANPAVKSKTGVVVTSIQTLLGELGAGSPDSSTVTSIPAEPASTVEEETAVKETPLVESPDESSEEVTSDSENEEALNEEALEEEAEDSESEEALEEESDEISQVRAGSDTIPAIASADEESVGEINLSEGEGEEEAEDEEDLPPIDDLLADE